MALKALLSTLDGLPEGFAEHYVQDGDTYRLQVEAVNGHSLEDVAGLKSALQKEKDNARKATERLKVFEDIDPDMARIAISKVDEMKNWTPEEEVQKKIEAQVASLREKLEGEATKKDERIAHLSSSLERAIKKYEIAAALSDPEVKGNLTLLEPVLERMLKVEEVDGRFELRVVDETGTVRASMQQGDHGPMGTKELALELRDKPMYAPAFEGTSASGTGAGGSGGGGRGSSANYTISEADAKDPQKYRAAQEEAKKAGKVLQIV